MKFLICNMTFFGSKILETELDEKIFKEEAFNSKNSIKGNNFSYFFVALPFSYIKKDINENLKTFLRTKTSSFMKEEKFLEEQMNLITSFLDKPLNINLLDVNFSIDVLFEIEDNQIDIFYSDGSFKKKTDEASYAVFKLLKESKKGDLDTFSEKKMESTSFSGVIKNGTNNIGELTGIKASIENFGEKYFQIIISDSEYSIKCFREWYYTWKNNNFKNYSGKEIKNKKLVTEIADLLFSQKKTVLFKWTKGHDKNIFNEKCDVLAKKILNIL